MTPEQAQALRKPFDPKTIGKLPKGNTQLDFVGHAAVTDRLLAVDPDWTWEPLAVGDDGLPSYQNGCLWIRLTVCGVTRIGVGDGPDPKQRIGDAIRNAAMRFGVALDLWSRQELEGKDPNGGDGEELSPLTTVASAALPEAADQVSGSASTNPSTDPAPSVEDIAQSIRDRVIEACGKQKREGIQQIARLSAEAAKARVLNAAVVRPDGSATTMKVLLDEAMRKLNTASDAAAQAAS